MKKVWIIASAVLFLNLPGFPQESFVEQSLVINVEVPVRVFKGATFIEDLGIDDFEVLEDGIAQKIEACYLVKKSAIQRREEKKKYIPETTRHFYLFFEVTDYVPKISEALDYFLENILIPSDNLVVITPVKTYRMKEKALQAKPRKAIAEELRGLIRKDCLEGNAEFRMIVADLAGIAKSLAQSLRTGEPPAGIDTPVAETTTPEPQGVGGKALPRDPQIEEQLVHYAGLIDKIDTLREISQMKMIDVADHLARQEGQKYVFLFYQREYIPQVEPKLIAQYAALYQDSLYIYQTLSNAAKFRDREMSFDVERVKQVYADASTAVHFLFITTPRPDVKDVYMEERSEDIFSAFREMARATGGIFETSANPASMFRNALEAAENYYLLYYTPKLGEGKGRDFRNIEVRVKKGDYQVLSRSGYFIR